MLFSRINDSSPERVFIVVYNSWATASLTNGQCVRWDYTTDCDGVGVTRSTSAASCGLAAAGVVAETIASGAYGLLQVYGYHSAVRVRTMTTSGHAFNENLQAIAKGVPLAYDITADVFCAEGIGAGVATSSFLLFPFAFALAAQASWTTKAIAAFIKAM